MKSTLQAYPWDGDKEADFFEVMTTILKSGVRKTEDSYFGLLVREGLEEKIHKIADPYFSDCKIYYEAFCVENDFHRGVSPERVIESDIQRHGSFCICVTGETAEDKERFMKSAMDLITDLDSRYDFTFEIFFLNVDFFNSLSRMNYSSKFTEFFNQLWPDERYKGEEIASIPQSLSAEAYLIDVSKSEIDRDIRILITKGAVDVD
jgi:hypothetical protein